MPKKILYFLNSWKTKEYHDLLEDLKLDQKDVIPINPDYDKHSQTLFFRVSENITEDLVFFSYDGSKFDDLSAAHCLAFWIPIENATAIQNPQIAVEFRAFMITLYTDIPKEFYHSLNLLFSQKFEAADTLAEKKQKYLDAFFKYFHVLDFVDKNKNSKGACLGKQALFFLQGACQDDTHILRIHRKFEMVLNQGDKITALGYYVGPTRSIAIAARFLLQYEEVRKAFDLDAVPRTVVNNISYIEHSILYKATLRALYAQDVIDVSFANITKRLVPYNDRHNLEESVTSKNFENMLDLWHSHITTENDLSDINYPLFVYFTEDRTKNTVLLTTEALNFIDKTATFLTNNFGSIKRPEKIFNEMFGFFEAYYPQTRQKIIDLRKKYSIKSEKTSRVLKYTYGITTITWEIPAVKNLENIYYYEFGHNLLGTPSRTEYINFEGTPRNYQTLDSLFKSSSDNQQDYIQHLKHYFNKAHHATNNQENLIQEAIDFVKGIINDTNNFCRQHPEDELLVKDNNGLTDHFETILTFFKENFGDVIIPNSNSLNLSTENITLNLETDDQSMKTYIDRFIENAQTENPDSAFFHNRTLFFLKRFVSRNHQTPDAPTPPDSETDTFDWGILVNYYTHMGTVGMGMLGPNPNDYYPESFQDYSTTYKLEKEKNFQPHSSTGSVHSSEIKENEDAQEKASEGIFGNLLNVFNFPFVPFNKEKSETGGSQQDSSESNSVNEENGKKFLEMLTKFNLPHFGGSKKLESLDEGIELTERAVPHFGSSKNPESPDEKMELVEQRPS